MSTIVVNSPTPAGWTEELVRRMPRLHPGIRDAAGEVLMLNDNFRRVQLLVADGTDPDEVCRALTERAAATRRGWLGRLLG